MGLEPDRHELSPAVVVVAPGQCQVRAMQNDDLRFAGELQAQALGHGFFVSLGPRFVNAYQRTFLDSPHSVAMIALVRGHRVGFLVGILRPRAHRHWVLRHRSLGLLLRGALAIAVRPQATLRFLRTRARIYFLAWRRERQAKTMVEADSEAVPAVLSHVAVLPGARGTGAGRQLVRSFEAAARAAGAGRATLTTLAGPSGGGRFYAQLQWSRGERRRTADGRMIEDWTRELGAD